MIIVAKNVVLKFGAGQDKNYLGKIQCNKQGFASSLATRTIVLVYARNTMPNHIIQRSRTHKLVHNL